MIADENVKQHIIRVSEEIFKIFIENEPLTKTSILFYLEKIYPNISNSQLDKSMKILKNSNRIQTMNRRDYIIVKKKGDVDNG